jgi:arginyl-tRNA synthetase
VALPQPDNADCSGLTLDEELALTKLLARYPEVVAGAAEQLEPHRLVFYLQELAAAFHSYYNRQRVLVDDPAVTRARLLLVNAVRVVLRNALELLGMTAPERM